VSFKSFPINGDMLRLSVSDDGIKLLSYRTIDRGQDLDYE